MVFFNTEGAITQWARVPQQREQMVLFAERLDDALPVGHWVRMLDESHSAHELPAELERAREPGAAVPKRVPIADLDARVMPTQDGGHAAQETYALRRLPGERLFTVIKNQFGLRRFLLRSLERAQSKWRWSAIPFNLHRLLSLLRTRAGPAATLRPLYLNRSPCPA